MSLLEPFRSLHTLPEKIRQAAHDPVYALLWSYARIRRREHATGKGIKKKTMQGARELFKRAYICACTRLFPLRGEDGGFLHWFSDQEAAAATVTRNRLLDALSGRVESGARGSKPYMISLSPGCEICWNGDWGCNLINRLCTRDCDFCKRNHSVRSELESETEGFVFATPSAHVEFIKSFSIKGVGFSGGEPLLVAERLVSHIDAIRKEFGSSLYLWMYTNGDLADRTTLMRLRDAGLDEIRFNLSAREYELSPVLIARECIPTVTVEIPAIPEDYEVVKALLPELQSVGVDFVNLHQLTVESQNWRMLLGRNYHIDCSTMGIFESEISVLRLLLHACEQQLRLPINYCSRAYKSRYQARGVRARRAQAVLEGFQEITDAGFIRSLVVSDSTGKVRELVRRIAGTGCDPGLWKVNATGKEVAVHSSVLACVDWSSSRLSIIYLEPDIALRKGAEGPNKANIKSRHRAVKSLAGLGQTAFEEWRSRYLDKRNSGKESMQVRDLAMYEELDRGLPDVC